MEGLDYLEIAEFGYGLNPVSLALKSCDSQHDSDEWKEYDDNQKRKLYCLGVDLKRFLKHKKLKTQIGENVITPAIVNMLFWNKTGKSPFEIASMLRKSFSPEFAEEYSKPRKDLIFIFDEIDSSITFCLEEDRDFG